MNKKNYFQNIAQRLNGKTTDTENSGTCFALLKIMEYWVRFLQADSDYLNVEPIVTLMNFETQTELVYALAKIEEIIRQERAALLAQAEAQAAAIREEILEEARRECNLLQAQAQQNREQALAYILSKGV